jgi:hypothetical protein
MISDQAETTGAEAFVYRIYGTEDALLYVGLTANVDARLSGHRQKSWWPEVERVEVDEFRNRGEAAIAEITAIYEEEPKYNAPLVNGTGPAKREGSGRPIGRPKLDDPTVPIAFRMRRSASDWWTARAEKEGTTLPKLIRRVLEEKADVKPLERKTVIPRLKGKNK